MRHSRYFAVIAALGLLLSACGGPAAPQATPGSTGSTPPASTGQKAPQAAEGTALRKIQDRGKIIVGVKYDVPLFGYLNPRTNSLEGFDVDMGHEIAKEIFGDPDAIEFKEAISANRIPYLKDGVVDLVASTMTINADRLKEIDFSDVYYLAGQSLLVPKTSAIKTVDDLKGKNVGTVKGSTSEKNIRDKAPEANVVLFDKYADAVAAMDAGQVEAVTTDDNILYGFVAASPDKYQVVGGQFTKEPYGIGIQQGHPELKDLVNKVVHDMKKDGRWAALYKKWIPGAVGEPPPDDWQAAAATK